MFVIAMRRHELFVAAWSAAAVTAAVALARWAPPLLRDALHAAPVHLVTHTLLFGVLAIALASRWWGTGGARALFAAAVFLAVAASQEALQPLVRAQPIGRDELYDLSLDVLGGALGLVLWARTDPERSRRVAHGLGWLLHPGVVAPLGLFGLYWTALGSIRAAVPWFALAMFAALPIGAVWALGVRRGIFSDADISVCRERPAFLAYIVAWTVGHLAVAHALGAPAVVMTAAVSGIVGAAALAAVTTGGFKVSAHVSVAVGLAVALAATSARAPWLFVMAAALLTWARVEDRRHTAREVAGAWALATSVAGAVFHLRP